MTGRNPPKRFGVSGTAASRPDLARSARSWGGVRTPPSVPATSWLPSGFERSRIASVAAMGPRQLDQLLTEQIAHYQAIAEEYETTLSCFLAAKSSLLPSMGSNR